VGAFFDARYDEPINKQNIVNGPVANLLDIPGAKVVVPGDTNRSMLFHRISLVGENQMPPLARNMVDEKAVEVIAQWIATLPPKAATLPKGWSDQDIGNVGISGEASFLNDRYNVLASGADIWEASDAFHYAFKPINGDGQIVAHVASMQYTDPWSKGGIMFRENTSVGAKYAFVGFAGQGGSLFQSRQATDTSTMSNDGPASKVPGWLKLVRTGNTFQGFVSTNGVIWQPAGNVTIPMAKTALVGLALTAHNNSVLNSTLYDKVTISKPEKASPATGATK
jgi:regulation of enolase protein 1 (concanavalin A-like superfamily)